MERTHCHWCGGRVWAEYGQHGSQICAKDIPCVGCGIGMVGGFDAQTGAPPVDPRCGRCSKKEDGDG